VNPNKPPAPAELPMMSPPMAPPASPPIDAPPPANLGGDVAQRFIQVIDRQVNWPSPRTAGMRSWSRVEEPPMPPAAIMPWDQSRPKE
jgi:hypothetical protein